MTAKSLVNKSDIALYVTIKEGNSYLGVMIPPDAEYNPLDSDQVAPVVTKEDSDIAASPEAVILKNSDLLAERTQDAPAIINDFNLAVDDSGNAILTWTNPAEIDLRAVKVLKKDGTISGPDDSAATQLVAFIGSKQGAIPGLKLSTTDSDYTPGTTNYAVFALDVEGRVLSTVTDGSNLDLSTAPPQASGTSTTAGTGEVTIDWTSPTSDELAEVAVRRKTGSGQSFTGPTDGDSVFSGTGSPLLTSNNAEQYVDTVVAGSYTYAIFYRSDDGVWNAGVTVDGTSNA